MLLPRACSARTKTSSLRTLKNIKNPQGFICPGMRFIGFLVIIIIYAREFICLLRSFQGRRAFLPLEKIDFWTRSSAFMLRKRAHVDVLRSASNCERYNKLKSWFGLGAWLAENRHCRYKVFAIRACLARVWSPKRIPRSNGWSSRKIYEALFGKKAWQGDEAHRGAFFLRMSLKNSRLVCAKTRTMSEMLLPHPLP